MLRSRKFFCASPSVAPCWRCRLTTQSQRHTIQIATVVANRGVCTEHFRLTFRLPSFPLASPGQFVHLGPTTGLADDSAISTGRQHTQQSHASLALPLLRRAFSIARLERTPEGVSVDVLYRVVGTGTQWLASLEVGGSLSVLGPMGNSFPKPASGSTAWLVAGGVGLPPMLWLAESLGASGHDAVAFCGARSRDLLALTLDANNPPAIDATRATPSSQEFGSSGVVIATDDGSVGFHGHVGAAVQAYHEAHPSASPKPTVYTCGPERMIEFVAEFCAEQGFVCHVCMERSMACGTGLCQSCVVAVRDETDSQGWRYRLCCADGPVFDASTIVWNANAPS